MKCTILIVLTLLASPLFAQQPSISYLMCDEAKSQLQIHGSFGIDSGSVSIEDTTLGVVSWSDSLIICDLPDSGKGAGGGVEVQTKNGVSNKRMLSIVNIRVLRDIYYYSSRDVWYPYGIVMWNIITRADLNFRSSIYPYEVSKSSNVYCAFYGNPIPIIWRDSSLSMKDSSFSVYGIIDPSNNRILVHGDVQVIGHIYPDDFENLKPKNIVFDSLGIIIPLISVGGWANHKWYDTITGHILFFENLKNSVTSNNQVIDPIRIYQVNNSVVIHSENPVRSFTASLYSIDGRLLKRTKLDISSPEIFPIDVSDVHTHFAILVLQTEKGVITRKLLF
jgi:hypothetical protein